MSDLSKIPQESLGEALEAAVREAVDDNTFRKVKRCSYAQTPQDTLGQLLGKGGNASNGTSRSSGNVNIADPAILDQLVTALLGQQAGQSTSPHQAFNRMRPASRSMRHSTRVKNEGSRRSSWLQNQGGGGGGNGGSSGQLPTIMEGSGLKNSAGNARTLSLSERALNAPILRNFLQTVSAAPHEFGSGREDEETGNGTGIGRGRARFGRRNSETPLTKNQL